MNKLSEKQLLIVTVGIAVLLTGGLGYLIWSDLQEVKTAEAKTAGLREQIQAAQGEIDQIPARESRVIANREIADKEVAILPEETEIETFWEVLERFGDESGVQINRITNNTVRSAVTRKGPSSSIDSVEQVVSLKASTDEFLRFMNLIENNDRIINVVEFSLSAGKVDEDDKVRHVIKLVLRTFTYNKKIANTIVSIADYDKKKESAEVKKWLSSIKIEEKETYALRTAISRRDPFLDVRRKREIVADNPDEVSRETQEALLQNLTESVRTLNEGLNIEDHLRKISDLWRLSQQMKENRDAFHQLGMMIEETRSKGLISIPELQEREKTQVEAPYKEISDRLGKIEEEKPPLTLQQVQEIHKRVAVAFDARDWRRMAEEIRSWKEISKDGSHVADEARELAGEIAEFKHRADVIQEFDKRKIVVSAIVFNPSGFRLAVINGKQAGEGDALDGDGRVIVSEIGENFVIFTTEGVDIKKQQTANR